jgi:hypothetical protein
MVFSQPTLFSFIVDSSAASSSSSSKVGRDLDKDAGETLAATRAGSSGRPAPTVKVVCGATPPTCTLVVIVVGADRLPAVRVEKEGGEDDEAFDEGLRFERWCSLMAIEPWLDAIREKGSERAAAAIVVVGGSRGADVVGWRILCPILEVRNEQTWVRMVANVLGRSGRGRRVREVELYKDYSRS